MSEQAKKQAKDGSGKTRFNRGKVKGQSWTALRDAAIKNGTFKQRAR